MQCKNREIVTMCLGKQHNAMEGILPFCMCLHFLFEPALFSLSLSVHRGSHHEIYLKNTMEGKGTRGSNEMLCCFHFFLHTLYFLSFFFTSQKLFILPHSHQHSKLTSQLGKIVLALYSLWFSHRHE